MHRGSRGFLVGMVGCLDETSMLTHISVNQEALPGNRQPPKHTAVDGVPRDLPSGAPEFGFRTGRFGQSAAIRP